jgi:hypothetical protein
MGPEALTAVTMNTAHLDYHMTWQKFTDISEGHAAFIFKIDAEDEKDTFIRNVGKFLPDYIKLYPSRLYCSNNKYAIY